MIMWALKKGNETKNTFKKDVKDKLVKEGWEVILDTLEKDKKKTSKTDTKDVK